LSTALGASTSASASPPRRRSWLSSPGWRTVFLSAASVVIAFAIWQFLSTVLFNPFLIPLRSKCSARRSRCWKSGEIFSDAAISMVRVLVGFTTGSLAGVVAGVLLGRIRSCTTCSTRLSSFFATFRRRP